MTGRRSRFWGSFWGETGRNSGKWISNKIFGSGWSTPYSIENKSRNVIDAEHSIEKPIKETTELTLNGISGNTLKEIKVELDETFILLKSNASRNGVSSSQLKFKIRSGITSLTMLGFSDYADFYKKEYRRHLLLSRFKLLFNILLGILLMFILLLISKGKLRF
jgi:hypothetical protein